MPQASLGLGPRMMITVGLALTLMLGAFGLLASVTVNKVIDAAGQEQVTVAQAIALQAAAAVDHLGPVTDESLGSGQAKRLLPPAPAELSVQLITESGTVLDQTGTPMPASVAQHLRLLAELMTAGQAGYRIHKPEQGERFRPHVVAYAPLPDHSGLGVVIQQGQATVLGALDQMLVRMALVGGGLVVLAIGAAWLGMQRIVKPLRSLTAAAESFAAGNVSNSIQIHRSDEVGLLAASFESMRRQLSRSLSEIEHWNEELEQRVANRTQDVHRRNQQLTAINALTERLSASSGAETSLAAAFDSMREICEFEVAVYRPPELGGTTGVVRGLNVPPALAAEDVQPGVCLCGRASKMNGCQYASKLAEVHEAAACRLAGLTSAVAVALPSTDGSEGVIFLGSRTAWRLESGDLDSLAAMGRQLGIALANARLVQRLTERNRERTELLQRLIDAQEDERRRLAQELHDNTSQVLASLQLGLERLTTDAADPATRKLAPELRKATADALAAVHQIAIELRPSVLDDIGLLGAIERCVREFVSRWGLPIDFAAHGVADLRLSGAAETSVFRIVQSALMNVVQHARARHASILLRRRDDNLVVVIEDDGHGFDLAALRSGPLESRLGLAGMEERAALIGASVTVETAPGAGTAIFLEVPLELAGRRAAA